uniref:MFS general substrate transporter n=1 Tax=Mycena chlorophos TaxID=658473 RepID=A0ABQ0LDL1_MYCCL|nr:predicted protein [Mycena chlorophos]
MTSNYLRSILILTVGTILLLAPTILVLGRRSLHPVALALLVFKTGIFGWAAYLPGVFVDTELNYRVARISQVGCGGALLNTSLSILGSFGGSPLGSVGDPRTGIVLSCDLSAFILAFSLRSMSVLISIRNTSNLIGASLWDLGVSLSKKKIADIQRRIDALWVSAHKHDYDRLATDPQTDATGV